MNAHPSAIKRICHHSSLPFLTTVGELMPVALGRGALPVPDGGAVRTSCDKHTPSPATTFELDWQLALTQAPDRNTWVELEHARQLEGPGPEHDEQVESHVWHEPDVESKYWFFEHVGRQRPLVSTGRLGGQDVHWLNEPPAEQDAQSGWQLKHAPDAEKVPDGQEEMQRPLEAS